MTSKEYNETWTDKSQTCRQTTRAFTVGQYLASGKCRLKAQRDTTCHFCKGVIIPVAGRGVQGWHAWSSHTLSPRVQNIRTATLGTNSPKKLSTPLGNNSGPSCLFKRKENIAAQNRDRRTHGHHLNVY